MGCAMISYLPTMKRLRSKVGMLMLPFIPHGEHQTAGEEPA
jgi:hypothetical protein